MTESEFLAALDLDLRVGRRARRRIGLELADHLRCEGAAAATDRLGSPKELAEDFNAIYAAHRAVRLRAAARVTALGLGVTLVGCAVLLSGGSDGDGNIWPEALLVTITTAMLAVGLASRRYRFLATSLGAVVVGWLVWSLRLVESGTGIACLLLLLAGLLGASATNGVARSLRQPIR